MALSWGRPIRTFSRRIPSGEAGLDNLAGQGRFPLGQEGQDYRSSFRILSKILSRGRGRGKGRGKPQRKTKPKRKTKPTKPTPTKPAPTKPTIITRATNIATDVSTDVLGTVLATGLTNKILGSEEDYGRNKFLDFKAIVY